MPTVVNIETMPLRRGNWWVLIVSSMEQIIGAVLSTVAGVMIPMLNLISHPELSTAMQGVLGASALVGISIGSPIIGKLSDSMGYLIWFRLCAVIIIIGSLISWIFPTVTCAVIGLFIAGVGVGGGYSLDQSYISEIMPTRWQQSMVGIAKGSCALGFMGAAGICYLMLKGDPKPEIWNDTMLIITALGVITLLMRIHWAESPRWLMLKGRTAEAQKATKFFLGDNVVITPLPEATKTKSATWGEMFRGRNLIRVIYSGIPWACEGLGVYGFGVFLPVLVLALGIGPDNTQGIANVINSVELTTVINFFILPGFALGLWLLNKINHVELLSWGFLICALGLVILMLGYLWHWPMWVMILGFVIFEIFLNAGPHLVTFVIPSQVYPVVDRAAGAGIASMLGKVGAVAGVFFMPIWLRAGGMTLVLGISIGVMVAGAVIGWIFGGILGLTKESPSSN